MNPYPAQPTAGSSDRARAELGRRFPDAVIWYGHTTRHWWAMLWCGRWRLVEATTPYELAHAINQAAMSSLVSARVSGRGWMMKYE